MILFYSFKEWKKYILSAIQKLLSSLLRIVWAIINGAASLLAGGGRSVYAFIEREPKAMCIICVLFILELFGGWMLNSINEQSVRTLPEMPKDSIILKFDSEKQNTYTKKSLGLNHWDCNE